MIGRREFAVAGISAAALAVLGRTTTAETAISGRSHERLDGYEKCAEACSACQRDCDFCATHCAELLAEGQKEHLSVLQSCRDCADFCATAAEVVGRQGPLATLICQACADACAACAKECEQHGRGNKIMEKCAQECHKCEKACRLMLSQVTASRASK